MFKDPILDQLIKKYPKPSWKHRSDFLFEDMIETIISQQLSIKAADTIFERFKNLFQTKPFPTPQQVFNLHETKIQSAGISRPKTSYIKNVAQAFMDKQIVIEEMKQLSDEQAIIKFTNIKGIGKWSAEMILIFTLNRPDVFSIGDLGIRNAMKNLYGITDQKEMLKLSEKWKPNRSLACWYLWRSLEN